MTIDQLKITYRTSLVCPKPYNRATFKELPDLFSSADQRRKLRDGEIGIYLGVYPKCVVESAVPGTTKEQQWLWPIFDIDGQPKSTKLAITAAKELYPLLREMDLARHAHWLLSGTGLRCVLDFLVPMDLLSGWLESLKAHKNQGLDARPYQSWDHDPPPMRMFCYRGHERQVSQSEERPDRHSVLVEEETLLALDEPRYLDLTKGRPDPECYISWTRRILPKFAYGLDDDSAPEEIKTFYGVLMDYKFKAEMERNLVDGIGFPASAGGIQIEALLDRLDELGIKYQEKESPIRYWQLDECPSCGERYKAYMLTNGRVYCWRTSCDADRESGGLPALEWAGEDHVKFVEAGSPVESNFVDLHTAELEIEKHLRKDGDTAFEVTPGVGKTRRAIALACEYARDQVVMYVMPNHRLLGEQFAKLKAGKTEGFPLLHFVGRRGDGELDKTCRAHRMVMEAQRFGYYPAATVCLTCPHSPIRKAGSVCEYYKQYEQIQAMERGLILCTSQSMPFLLSSRRLNLKAVERLFIDEQVLSAMLQKQKDPVGLDEMFTLRRHLSAEARKILELIEKAAKDLHSLQRETGQAFGRIYTKRQNGGQWKDGMNLWQAARITRREAREALGRDIEGLLAQNHSELYRNHVNRNALTWLAAALNESDLCWISVGEDRKKPIRFERIKHWTIPESIRLTILDATADPLELSALFGRAFDLLKLNVSWEGSRIWLRQSMYKSKAEKLTVDQIRGYMEAIAKKVPETATRGLLVTHQKVEKRALSALRAECPEIEWQCTHYHASRGLNAYEKCEVVVCFGVPGIQPTASYDNASALFPDRPEYWDPWRIHLNNAELYQSVHRARFVRNPGRTLIIMGHYWPEYLLGKPDYTKDRRRKGHSFKEAVERAQEFLNDFGFFTKETAAFIGIGMEKDEGKIGRIMAPIRRIAEALDAAPPSTVERKRGVSSFFINNILRVKNPSNLILSANNNWWTELIRQLGGGQPDVPDLSVKLPDWGHTWSHGVGSISKAEKFYTELAELAKQCGIEMTGFNPANWRAGSVVEEVAVEPKRDPGCDRFNCKDCTYFKAFPNSKSCGVCQSLPWNSHRPQTTSFHHECMAFEKLELPDVS
jgi:hypothetical protein